MPVFSRSLGSISANDPNAIRLLANHIRIMQEELEYRLNNLDSSNINEINLDETEIFSIKADKKIVFDAGHVLTIDSDGATIVDGDGNAVKISHGNLELTGAITFADLDEDVQNQIDSAITSLPSYIKSTKITKTTIESPTIKANEFNVFSLADGASAFNLYGQYDSEGSPSYRIDYGLMDDAVPTVTFSGVNGSYGYFKFDRLEFAGYTTGGYVDFSGVTVTGVTAEFA